MNSFRAMWEALSQRRWHSAMSSLAAACILLTGVGDAWAGILRAGDVIEIHVGEHPELSKKVLIRTDGTVDYPFLEDRSLLTMTPSEVSELLTFRLAKSIPNPFVLVTRSEHMPIQIRVLGQINKPGVVQLEKGACLQEVIVAAGGATAFADLSNVKIIREKARDVDALMVDFRSFLEGGEIGKLPEIRNNDTVILLMSPRSSKVKILGAVSRPGYYDILGETSIFDAVYLAGGPASKANLSKIRHILRSDGKDIDQVVDLQEYLDEGRLNEVPMVKEGDVVVVYKKFITWRDFLSLVRDALMLFTAYQVFAR